jgi:hypothetical protein
VVVNVACLNIRTKFVDICGAQDLQAVSQILVKVNYPDLSNMVARKLFAGSFTSQILLLVGARASGGSEDSPARRPADPSQERGNR